MPHQTRSRQEVPSHSLLRDTYGKKISDSVRVLAVPRIHRIGASEED